MSKPATNKEKGPVVPTNTGNVVTNNESTTEIQRGEAKIIEKDKHLKTPSGDFVHDQIQTALQEMKERCKLLETFADQSLSVIDPASQEAKSDPSDIRELVKKYKHGLATMYMEHIYFCQLNECYKQAIEEYAELSNLVNILQNEELDEAKSIIDEGFTSSHEPTKLDHTDHEILKKKHCDAMNKASMFLNTINSTEQKRSEYDTFCTLYNLHLKAFNLQEAMDLNTECFKIADVLDDKPIKNICLEKKGHLYTIMGKLEESYEIFKGLLLDGIEDRRMNMALVVNTSVVLLLLGKRDGSLEKKQESLKYALKSLELGREGGDLEVMAVSHGNIGLANVSMGNYGCAIEHFKECLQLGEQRKDDRIINNSYCNLGRAYEGLEQDEMAKYYYEKAVNTPQPPFSHWCDTEDMRFSGDYLLAKLLMKENNWAEAQKHLQTAVERCEMQRKSIQDSPLKIVFNDTQRKPYQYLQHVLLQQGDNQEALLVGEKARARDFFDKVVRENENISLNSIEDLLKFVKKQNVAILMLSTLEVVNKLCGWLITPSGIIKEFSVENIDWRECLSDICVSIHQLQADHETEYRGVEEHDQKSLVGSGEGLLLTMQEMTSKDYPSVPTSFRFGDDGGKDLPCSESQAGSTVLANDTGIRKDKNFSSFIEKLSSLVLKPIECHLEELIKKCREKPKLVFIPQLATFNIPFAALQLRGEPLCNSITPLEAFSFHSLFHCNYQLEKSNQSEPGDVLIVGNPTSDLANAEIEANLIGELLSVKPLIGPMATHGNVMSHLPDARIIHFACHGVYDGKSLLMAPDQNGRKVCLTVNDITKVKADLVVLSACHTHRGKLSSEGVLGLARALLMAGAKSVVTALWAIPDEATLYFMDKFYRKLINRELVANALAMTMSEMQKIDRFKHVVFWGAFKLLSGPNCKVF